MAAAHIAVWKVGAVTVPLSTLFGADGLRHRLTDCEVSACIFDETAIETLQSISESLPALSTVVSIGMQSSGDGDATYRAIVEETPPVFETFPTAPDDDDAVIIYISGTTGTPKGVRHTHDVLLGHLPVFFTTFCNASFRESDVFYTPSEWAWIASLFDILFPALYYAGRSWPTPTTAPSTLSERSRLSSATALRTSSRRRRRYGC